MKLPEPKKFNVPVRTANNEKIHEYRYNLENLDIYKEDLDDLVRAELKRRVQKEGGLRVEVMYLTDQAYSTDFVQINSPADVDKLQLKRDAFVSYDEDPFDDGHNGKVPIDIMSLYIAKVKVKVGDNDRNSCLPDALRLAFVDPPKILKSNEAFKTFVGVQEWEKVDLQLLPKIEKELQMNIDVCGQYTYTNPVKYPRAMKIRVARDHVEHVFAFDEWKPLTNGYSMLKRLSMAPIIFKKMKDRVKLCHLSKGKTGSRVILEEPVSYLSEFKKSNPLNSRYFLKRFDDPKLEPEDVIKSDINNMKDFQQSAYKYLGSRMAGCLNPFHSKFKPAPIASHYWCKHAPKSISRCDPYAVDEDIWIRKAMSGGLMFVKSGTYHDAHEYDINSMYPALMCAVDFVTRQGTFTRVSKIPKLKSSDQYCIYRCTITGFDNRIFQGNRHGYYCGLDILTAQQGGYKVELTLDGGPNCLIYDKSTRIPGSEVFTGFVQDMFKLKRKKVKVAKAVINCLWGMLASKNIWQIKTDSDKKYILRDLSLVQKIGYRHVDKETNVQHYIIKAYKSDRSSMKFRLGRFVPFMLARGRRIMCKFIKPHKDHLVRCHTDGAIFDRPIKGVELSSHLGGWKHKSGTCIIKTLNSIRWQ